MGKLALAAKITHVPSMYLSELPGPRHGTRQDAIDGHVEIGRRFRLVLRDPLRMACALRGTEKDRQKDDRHRYEDGEDAKEQLAA